MHVKSLWPIAIALLALNHASAQAQQLTLACYGDFNSESNSRPATLHVAIAGEMAILSQGPLAEPLRAAVTSSDNQYRITAPDTVLIIDRKNSHFSYLERRDGGAVGGRGKCQADTSAQKIPLRSPG